jgi:V8-like Glu-specific endopeptidase
MLKNYYFFVNSTVSDFALLELNQRPSGNTGITYAGWSRSTITLNSAVGIHHPKGDVMKISFENDVPTQVSYDAGDGIALCWRVIWTSGTTEIASSGSPLYNQNHRIVGQLYGGTASCNNPSGHDNYGRFDVSWTNGLTLVSRKIKYAKILLKCK